MSYPCVNTTQFDVVSGALTPKDEMQWRHVATASQAAIQNNYVYNGGNQAADLFQLQVAWTNPSAQTMKVYGLLTRGGTIMTSNPRNRAYIETYFGEASGTAPADPTPSTLFGRFGCGIDFGTVTVSSTTYTGFTNHQLRQSERTSAIGTLATLTTGQTYKLRVKLRFDAAFWETLGVYPTGAASETEFSINTGATRLDLFSYPAL